MICQNRTLIHLNTFKHFYTIIQALVSYSMGFFILYFTDVVILMIILELDVHYET